MKKIILLTVAITTTTQAQIAKKVIESYPAHIVYKIHEVASKVELTEDQQMKIGERLTKRDSLANVSMRRGDSISLLKKYFTVEKGLLKSILSTAEIENFQSQKNKKNRFLIALNSASDLKLTPNQIDAIRTENNSLKQNEPLEKQLKIFAKKLDSILTKPQYGALIKIINTEKSAKQASDNWNNLLNAKMVTSEDSIHIYKKIYEYQLLKNCTLDVQPETLNAQKKADLKEKIILEHEPNILTRYQIATNGFYKKNLFADAIFHEKTLKLSPSQIDSLLVYYRKKPLLKLENKQKNRLPESNFYENFENTAISKILNTKQINTLLVKKNEKTAMQLAQNNWDELEKQGKTKDLDKKTALKEWYGYHLKHLVASNLLKIDKSSVNLFHKRDIELKKPEILRQLDAERQAQKNAKSTKNALKW